MHPYPLTFVSGLNDKSCTIIKKMEKFSLCDFRTMLPDEMNTLSTNENASIFRFIFLFFFLTRVLTRIYLWYKTQLPPEVYWGVLKVC